MGNGPGPLSEVSPVAQRRNSPSWNPNTKQTMLSPEKPASPRLFWQGRDFPFQRNAENQATYSPDAPVSQSRRASIENLKRASRVKNSNMFRECNPEYDPTQVYVPQRPLATGRSPQREPLQSYVENDPDGIEHPVRPSSPSKDQPSPAKSSLSKASRFGPKGAGFDPQNEIWSDSRHAKSVTFDVAPPQINEYEMTTPDPSTAASDSHDGSYDSDEYDDDEEDTSFDHDSSAVEDSFDASLEDTEKTPVVLPDDWHHDNDEMIKDNEESFTETGDDSQHIEDVRPPSRQGRPQEEHSGAESVDSNDEPRPLPPLPSVLRSQNSRPSSPNKLSAALELGSGAQRTLPCPPAAANYSKEDISKFSNASMSLEERLRLMALKDDGKDTKSLENNSEDKPEENGENLEQPGDKQSKEENEAKSGGIKEPKAGEKDTAEEPEVFSPPRISRDSILRDLRKGDDYNDESDVEFDPDVPIPSLEDDEYDDDDTESVVIKEEDDDDYDDLYDIPDYYETVQSQQSSMRTLNGNLPHDSSSHYSLHSAGALNAHPEDSMDPEDRQSTPVAQVEFQDCLEQPQSEEPQAKEPQKEEKPHHEQQPSEEPKEEPKEEPEHEPEHEPEPEPELERPATALDMSAIRETLQDLGTPENDDEPISEPSSPGSVIHHPMDDDDDGYVSPDESVPATMATVKAHGIGLKTRPSLTPADLESMAATRRKISGAQAPPVPPVPTLNRPPSSQSEPTEPQAEEQEETDDDSNKLAPPSNKDEVQRKTSLMKLDIPFSIQEESLGFGLDKEFDRVMENQKRGYLMRQNTKVIVASSHNEEDTATTPGQAAAEARISRTPGNTTRKPSQQTWTTVPWNSGRRRSSIRTASGIPKKKPVPGSVPPLPGQQSNVQDATAPVEDTEPALNDALDEGEERGRLFVKVVGMKYLDMPLPKGERSYFALTLDNGLHCVTTSWLELGKSAPIGQEFELIVQNDLEFQLTLQMKVDEEKMRPQEAAPPSPTKQKSSTLSRVFQSPRKRKELEMRNQLTEQRQSQDVNASVWDRLRTTVAQDGSFGRSYVSLSDHEKEAYGRPYTVDVACFNEWAVEDQINSVKSKKSTTSAASQRRPPYKIGKLELQLLFVPKPKGAKDDDMPKSMNSCIREMRDAESVSTRSWEGFLSQQGGDCPYWRRRFFKLQGSKLTAYHETTRQPRATINLTKAAKLIDDRSSLTQKETTTRNGGRRKSAFAEEEDGYMFVEEGFRIRFANGEVIDFYADSAADKDGWMKVLSDSVGKGMSSGGSQAKPWTELVLRRERSMKARRTTGGDGNASSSARTAPPPPPSPTKSDAGPQPPASSSGCTPSAPAPSSTRSKHKHTQSQPEARLDYRRSKTRSLIF